jgi:hypothetical protein
VNLYYYINTIAQKWKIPAVESVILCDLLWKSYWIIEQNFSLQIHLNQNSKLYSWNLGTLLILLESLQRIRFNEGDLEIFRPLRVQKTLNFE